MPGNNRISNIAPMTVITIAAFFAASLAALTTIIALNGPWLGIDIDHTYEGSGVLISSVQDNSPAAGILAKGDIINTLVTAEHGRVELSPLATLEDPDQLESFEKYNAFFSLQQKIQDAISSPSLTAELEGGRAVELKPIPYPSFTALPISFWWMLFFGGTSLVLGISAWSMRRSEPVTIVLAMSGLGFMIGAYSCAIYAYRELSMPAELFLVLSSANHIGIMIFAYAAVLVFWYYPKRLGNGPAGWVAVFGVSALWLNEIFQLVSWPMHAFYAHFVVAYCLVLIFAYQQWRRSRGSPLQRVMLKWMLSTVLLSLGFSVLLFYIPTILMGRPAISNVVTFSAVFLFYLGLVIGNIRYHQFDMELWWIRAWKTLAFISVALISDSLFVYFLNMTNKASLGLSLGLGILYLIVRQWFWGRFSGNRSKALDRALPHLITTLIYQKNNTPPDQQWLQLITRVFNPLSLKAVPEHCEAASIEQGGLALQFPDTNGTGSTLAICCDQGNRLFNQDDVNLTNRLLELMLHSIDINRAREQGMQEERHRIQRDLHDDVAARLLSLLHQTREPAISRFAQNALRGLRDVIHLLDAEEASLSDVMSDIEANAREQITGSGVNFEWRSPEKWPSFTLNPQQHINLRRIAREAIANALRHALPKNIILEVAANSEKLCLHVSNDGAVSDPANWKANRGLNNIRSRASEMGGSHRWSIEQGEGNARYCQLAVCMPITMGGNFEKHIAG